MKADTHGGGHPNEGGNPVSRYTRCVAHQGRRDGGSATVWVLAAGLVLVLAGMGGAAVGAARVSRHQAQVAADFGALAGAMRAVEGAAAACARAADLVDANRARMASCHVNGLDVVVSVDVDVALLLHVSGTASATARAGPVTALPEGAHHVRRS